MLKLIDSHIKALEFHLDVRSLTFECDDPTSRYYGKNIVIARWSIQHDRSDKPATNPCWDVFGRVLLAS